MSNKLIAMQLVRILIQSLLRDVSQRQIARDLHLSRNTVKEYARRITQSPYSLAALQELDDSALSEQIYPAAETADPDPRREDFSARTAYFLSELKRTGVTRLLLWEEYRKEYPEGYEYSRFCDLLSDQQKVQGASLRLSYSPAEVIMVDFAGDSLFYTDHQSGEMIFCPVLVCVLPYSGYSYAVALPDAKLPRVISGLNRCLNYFAGVPFSLKCDNMKQAVSRSCRYEPVFTEALQQWALHCRISLVAARVRKPKDKAPVENEVKLTYQRIYAPLRDKTCFSIEELNSAIAAQLDAHHTRPFQRKGYSRRDLFLAEEQSLLQPLPQEEYHVRHSVSAKVQKNYHITLGEDWHHYSVPFGYIGKQVQAIYDSDTVEVYFQHQRIALHTRSFRKHSYTTLKEHMPEGHQNYFEQRGWDAAYFLTEASKAGASAREYVQQMLKGKRFTEQTYNACLGLIRLGKTYGRDRLEAACKRALAGRNYTYRTIHNILINNLDQQQIPEADLFHMPPHDNLRGPEAYQ